MRRLRRFTAAALVIALAAAAGLAVMRRGDGTPAAEPLSGALHEGDVLDTSATAPAGVRIRVQVLNASERRGLARTTMLLLRDRGFDVVGMGSTRPLRDSTLVLDRSGHPDWAKRVARALGGDSSGLRVESRPDSSGYLDVVVLLGARWRAPAEPFHP